MSTPLNLGHKSIQMLALAGFNTLEQLREVGAVQAFVRIKQHSPQASLNLLWAIEGALTNQHWRDVAKNERLRLLLALEDASTKYYSQTNNEDHD